MMMRRIISSGYTRLFLSILFSVQLVACGLDGDMAMFQDSTTGNDDVQMSGSVGDGPVTGATILLYGSSGTTLGSMISDNTASFKHNFKIKGKEFPVLLEVNGGTDLVTGRTPDFQMLSVMMNPSDREVIISPFTTLIVGIAQLLPNGINVNNIAQAISIVMDKLGFGLDPALMEDPITSLITEENVASLVKACEAVGEMVRRTRDRMSEAGRVLSGDDVVAAIVADLVDGALDGKGTEGTDPRISAVANVVSGQVLVEALSNNLKVDGLVATTVMDQAIQTTNPMIQDSQLTGSVRITAGMLNQTRVALRAARVLDSSEPVLSISSRVDEVVEGELPQDVETLLPADTGSILDTAVSTSVVADDDQIQAVNEVISSGGVGDVGTVNTAPVISGTPGSTVVAGDSYVFQPAASDADGDALSFSISGKPGWAGFNSATGRLSGVPADSDVGTYSNILISVSDGTDTASLPAFGIQVEQVVVPNTAPVISGTPGSTVVAGDSYVFQPAASDADGDALSFSISGKPGWAGFNSATGRLSGVPADSDVGTYSNILISVSDGTDTASLPAFGIQVEQVVVPNTAPVISGTPGSTVVAGDSYVFQPAASDADGDALSFSISGKPGWAGFNSATGRLSGVPADSDVGTYRNILISVSDGTDTASLSAFTITVEAANTPPVISGTPGSTVVAGDSYVFQPAASDADGDALSFSISGKPGWADFDSATGRLSGVPLEADVGVYGNIVVSVSDGESTVSMAPFDIEVVTSQVQTFTFNLSWTAPATREDGSPLSLADIQGFRFYYGERSGRYTNSLDITDGTATSAVIDNISAGDYYLVMTTYDNDGRESSYSAEQLISAR